MILESGLLFWATLYMQIDFGVKVQNYVRFGPSRSGCTIHWFSAPEERRPDPHVGINNLNKHVTQVQQMSAAQVLAGPKNRKRNCVRCNYSYEVVFMVTK